MLGILVIFNPLYSSYIHKSQSRQGGGDLSLLLAVMIWRPSYPLESGQNCFIQPRTVLCYLQRWSLCQGEITINVPVVFMARYVVVLRGAKSLRGPTPSNAPSYDDVAPLQTIKYKRHKNKWYIGSLMYPSAVV